MGEDRQWTPRIAAHLVAAVRERLAGGRGPVPGILREDGVGEAVGNVLNHNLIRVLLRNTTLMPDDLGLLRLDDASTPPEDRREQP